MRCNKRNKTMRKAKKILVFMLMIVMIFTVTGCRYRIIADNNSDKTTDKKVTDPVKIAKKLNQSATKPNNYVKEKQSESGKPNSTGKGNETSGKGNGSGNKGSGGNEEDNQKSKEIKEPSNKKSNKTFTITFNPNGGRIKSANSTMTINQGDAYGELPMPIREGYDFQGWFKEKTGETKISESDIFKNLKDQTLYAQWKYDPYSYWKFKLDNTVESIYPCQQKSIYLEFDADNVTTKNCSLILNTGSFNIAERVNSINVTDEWVGEKNPDVIIKCVSNYGSASSYYNSISERFPEKRVIVISNEAVNGSAYQRLYYDLYLAKALYPDWFTGVDMPKVGSELNVGGNIYDN